MKKMKKHNKYINHWQCPLCNRPATEEAVSKSIQDKGFCRCKFCNEKLEV